tara:strand:+ start:506 stop:655 length:150 start_codon:yes stop_codon:yes gene_type:complete
MNKELWDQAVRLAKALDDANKVKNIESSKIHHKALLEVLKEIIKMESEK